MQLGGTARGALEARLTWVAPGDGLLMLFGFPGMCTVNGRSEQVSGLHNEEPF